MKKFRMEDINLTAKLTEFTIESGFTKKSHNVSFFRVDDKLLSNSAFKIIIKNVFEL